MSERGVYHRKRCFVKWWVGVFLFPLALWAKSDAEWMEKLGRERYNVLRKKSTERAFMGKYVFTQIEGLYVCAGCDHPLFRSVDKYQIGCGWPTFTQAAAPKSVYYLEDWSMGFKRYEVLCRSCDGHLGHVFNDGPPPKNFRYTINSLALKLQTP